MNKMKRGSEQDDPYSDWWMLRIEDKLDQTTTLQRCASRWTRQLASVPPALSLGENLNVQPVKLPLFVNAQLGFAAVYLLADYDDIARKLILAHHTALIDRSTGALNEARTRCAACSRWPSSTATRAARATTSRRNAAARAALEKFGELPQDVLEGTRRSKFAPPIVRRGLQQRVRVLPQRRPSDEVTDEPPLTRTRSQRRPARTSRHERSEPRTPLLPGLQQASCGWNTRPL
jgi:integrating conjugative element protein (TIGR03761 family)